MTNFASILELVDTPGRMKLSNFGHMMLRGQEARKSHTQQTGQNDSIKSLLSLKDKDKHVSCGTMIVDAAVARSTLVKLNEIVKPQAIVRT